MLLLLRVPQTSTNSTSRGFSSEALSGPETAGLLSRKAREASNVLRIGELCCQDQIMLCNAADNADFIDN
ncbi:unnamed protein product [Dibothriocephalus latus]|uniref:Uncharacterized protein n=1 Tax=Dibothriocephalus latus TaxID=60516 RepID=A0A3P7NTJ7_DIBLA|nr:unnamed protein product [Dibothriocephalus latus]